MFILYFYTFILLYFKPSNRPKTLLKFLFSYGMSIYNYDIEEMKANSSLLVQILNNFSLSKKNMKRI